MKIALVAPIWGVVNKKYAQGITDVVYSLADGLTKRGHDVVLFAPKGSKTPAKLFRPAPPSLYDDFHMHFGEKQAIFYRFLYAGQVAKNISGFDVVHSHLETDFLPFTPFVAPPVVTTIHGVASSYPARKKIFLDYKDANFVSLSNAARKNIPQLHYVGTVYNGIDPKKYPYNFDKPENYYLWLGRFNKDKAPHLAIEVAKKTKTPLYMAGSGTDTPYFKKMIRPHLKSKYVKVLPWMSMEEKVEYYKNAKAFLMPIQWEEPFGLVITESMACGTPVIAFNRGSMGELIKNGKTGFVVKSVPEMIRATKKIPSIERRACRKRVEDLFTTEKMVDNYEKIYKKLAKKRWR